MILKTKERNYDFKIGDRVCLENFGKSYGTIVRINGNQELFEVYSEFMKQFADGSGKIWFEGWALTKANINSESEFTSAWDEAADD